MKKRFLTFLVALLCYNVSATNDPSPKISTLILYGDITTEYKTIVTLFEFDTTDCVWYKVETQRSKRDYELLLDPTKAYQVWFQQEGGYTKILYIDPGDPGAWKARMDINFNSSLAFAHMYQICSQGLGTYTVEFLSGKHAENDLPATNCDTCKEKELQVTSN